MAFISGNSRKSSLSVVAKIQSRKFGKQEIYGGNWEAISKGVRETCGYICSNCKKNFTQNKNKLQTDHIAQISKGGLNSLVNLRALCIDCHKKKTAL